MCLFKFGKKMIHSVEKIIIVIFKFRKNINIDQGIYMESQESMDS